MPCLVVEGDQLLGLRLKQGSDGRVRVTGVQTPGNPAVEKAGIKVGDSLTHIDDTKVSVLEYKTLLQTLRKKRPLILHFDSCSVSETNEAVSFLGDDSFNLKFRKVSPNNAHHNKDSIQNVKSDLSTDGVMKVNVDAEPGRRRSREELFDKALEEKDADTLKQLAFTGIPEKHRAVCWQILLGYLDLEKKETWSSLKESQLELYRTFKKEVMWESANEDSRRPERLEGQGWWEFEDPSVKTVSKTKGSSIGTEPDSTSAETELNRTEMPTKTESDPVGVDSSESLVWQLAEEDPLSSGTAVEADDKLEEKREDRELREEIWKDAQRTHPGLHFFTEQTCHTLERILFIYAKLNPGVRYVQGMNEILAPIAFVFDCNKSEQNEADAFFCFCNLMSEIRDMYIKGLDSTSDGLKGRIDSLMLLLKKHDRNLHLHLANLEINPQFYALRWLTTLLSREFELPDTVRLWDSLFADKNRFNFLLYVSCAMLREQRDSLLANDFADCLKLLQHYPSTDVAMLLAKAHQMHEFDRKKDTAGVPQLASKLKEDVTFFLRKLM
mmetsp:Transcript_7284/g.8347  ORF Transcript_7284/g.8347 Transcript_7284/m.8347 type:complete len:554 (+) Transcript_7284:99-1760(+)